MNADGLREYFHKVLPVHSLKILARECGVVERERQKDVAALVVALVLCGGTHQGGRQFDVLREYCKQARSEVGRGTFYGWFDAKLELLLRGLLDGAMQAALTQPKLLPGVFSGVSDWRIVDSSTIKLPKELFDTYSGTGDYAAIKVHKEYSVGLQNMVHYHFSPAREHDSRHLAVDESRRGSGLMFDLGYVGFARLKNCLTFNVRFVCRLKDNWKPAVNSIVGKDGLLHDLDGETLEVVLDNKSVVLDGDPVDMTVTLGRGKTKVCCRLVGVMAPTGQYRFYLTDLSRDTHSPQDIATMYRVRWEIEIDNKTDKSGTRMDEIKAKAPHSVRTLILASLLSSTIACHLVHQHNCDLLVPTANSSADPLAATTAQSSHTKMRAPLHPLLMVRALQAWHEPIALALLGTSDNNAQWTRILDNLTFLSRDPNWRSRPSVLDSILGLTAPPIPRRSAKKATCSHLIN